MPEQLRADIADVIECAAALVDTGVEVDDEYRRGVVELASRICLPGANPADADTVMAFAVYGVRRPITEVPHA